METKHLLYILISLIVVCIVFIGYDIYHITHTNLSCISDPIGYIKNNTGCMVTCLKGG